MNVRSCMTTDPVTVRPDTQLEDAIQLMRASDLRHLPVVDDDNNFVGVLREHQVRATLANREHNGTDVAVLGITELGTPTLHGDDSTENAWAVLSRSPGFDPIPVVANGKLEGTVSQHELLRALAGLPRMESETRYVAMPLLSEWASRSAPYPGAVKPAPSTADTANSPPPERRPSA